MERSKHLGDLLNQRQAIQNRLDNTSILLASISRYRSVYDRCLAIEANLAKGDLSAACSRLIENREVLESIRSNRSQEYNQQLLALLTRATDRKFAKIRSILEDQLHQRIHIKSSSLFIETFSSDQTSKFHSISLSILLQLIQQLSLSDILLSSYFTHLGEFALACISPSVKVVLHHPYSYLTGSTSSSSSSSSSTMTTSINDDDSEMILLKTVEDEISENPSSPSSSLSLSNAFIIIQYLLQNFFLLNEWVADYFEEGVYRPMERALLSWIQVWYKLWMMMMMMMMMIVNDDDDDCYLLNDG